MEGKVLRGGSWINPANGWFRADRYYLPLVRSSLVGFRCARNKQTHVLRGGSWLHLPWSLRSAYRGWSLPDDRYNRLGFRLVRRVK
jgi:formylglycine-generating enzyme required for sulfatase activity